MTTQEAINKYGARAVYRAATRHMSGDTARGLASVGLSVSNMGDVWRIHSLAYAQMGDADKAIDYADARARLDETDDWK